MCLLFFFVRTEQSTDSGEWLTEAQIMSFNGYNNPDADAYAEVKSALLAGLPSRDHEKPEMAALNIKQYHYVRHKTEQSSGSRKDDTLITANEVDEKTAERIAKSFDAGDFAVQDGNAQQPNISIEPWKKEAMDLERKVGSLQTRAGKALQVAKSVALKLARVADAGNLLADAQRSNLSDKTNVLGKALEDFQFVMAPVDTKTENRASEYAKVALPAMAVLKEHCQNFEKVLRMANNYMNMCE